MQVSTHGYPPRVGARNQIRIRTQIRGVVPASKKSKDRARSTGPIGFTAEHGLKQAVATVLFGPEHGQPTRIEFKIVHQAHRQIISCKLARTTVTRMTFLLRQARRAQMGIRAGNHPVLERIDAVLFFKHQTLLSASRT